MNGRNDRAISVQDRLHQGAEVPGSNRVSANVSRLDQVEEGALAERVNDFATPGVINLLCKAGLNPGLATPFLAVG